MGRTDRRRVEKLQSACSLGILLKHGISNSRENQELTLLRLPGGSGSGPPDWLGKSGLWCRHLYVNRAYRAGLLSREA